MATKELPVSVQNEIKIFEIHHKSVDEKEWVAAESIIGAIICLCTETATEIHDLEPDAEIIELPREKWSEYKVKNTEWSEGEPDEWKEMTFEEWLKENNNKPCYIAGTMHD